MFQVQTREEMWPWWRWNSLFLFQNDQEIFVPDCNDIIEIVDDANMVMTRVMMLTNVKTFSF